MIISSPIWPTIVEEAKIAESSLLLILNNEKLVDKIGIIYSKYESSIYGGVVGIFIDYNDNEDLIDSLYDNDKNPVIYLIEKYTPHITFDETRILTTFVDD